MKEPKQKEKKLRVFFNSNATWVGSGYGMQAAELLPMIRDAGYPLAICNFFGQSGGKFMLDGILQYPVINHVYGSDALVHHANDFKADVVFTLQDIWVLHPQDLSQVKRWIPITPVDADPIPAPVYENLRYAHRVISCSNFGHDKLLEKGIHSTYIGCTVNTEIFKPMDKAERKAKAGIPADHYLFGMVAANKDNPPRKSFQEVLEAFREFLKVEPKSLLYIHTNPDQQGGFPITRYADFLGIKDKILYPDLYQMTFNTPKESMAKIYNTFDCYLAPSMHEGFCVPLIEAQACGVPVIANNWTSMRELVLNGESGYLTEVYKKAFSPMMSYTATPSVPSIVDAMTKIYKANRKQMGENGRRFIVREYDTKKVFKEKWIPYLEKLEKEIYNTTTV